MGRITSSGCVRNDRITRDEVECDPVVPGAATRREPTPSDQVTKVMMFLLYTDIKLTTTNSILTISARNGKIDTV